MTAPTPPNPPLVWQPLEIPLRGGLAEQMADEVLDGQGAWLTMHDVRYVEGGALRRRPGFAEMGLSTGFPLAATGAAVCGREALLIGAGLAGGAAYEDPAPSVYRYSETAQKWIKSSGQIAPAVLRRKRGPRMSILNDSADPCPALAVSTNGYMCQVWISSVGTTDDLWYRVIDLSNGTVVVPDTMATDRVGTWVDVVACGTAFWLLSLEGGDTDIKCQQLPTSTFTLGALQTIATAVGTFVKIDATPESSTYFDLVYVDSTAANTILHARVNATATISVTTRTARVALANVECLACHAFSGSPGQMAFAWIANNNVLVDCVTLDPPTWTSTWGAYSTVDLTFNNPAGVGITRSQDGDWIVTYDGDSAAFSVYAGDRSSTYVRAFTSLGVARSNPRYCHWTRLASKPFTTTDGTFVWLRHVSNISRANQFAGVVLVCVSDVYDPNEPLRPVGNAFAYEFQFGANVNASAHYPLNFRTAVDGATAYTPFMVQNGLGASAYYEFDYLETVWTKPAAHLHQYVENQNCTNFTGSVLSSYDGAVAHEHGFLGKPWIHTATVGAGGSGSIEGDASNYVYSYVAVYAWDDDRGNRWYSMLSNQPSATLDAAHNNGSVTLVLSTIGPTNKHWVGDHRKPKILIYRTLKNASTYYYVGEVVADWTARTVSFTDTLSDAAISSRETVYTTGEVLESWAPPSSLGVTSHRGRLWSISGDDDRTIYASRVLVAGEAPAWSPLLTMRLDDSPDGAVALASLDDKLVILTRSRIYVAVGDGPNDAGAGEPMPTPILVSADAGCLDPRSVVATGQGVVFLSRAGFSLLSRKLEVIPFGKPVEQTLSQKPDIVAACHDAERSCVFWYARSSAGSSPLVFVLDYGHDNAWLTWSTPQNAGTPGVPVGMALLPGTTVYGNNSSKLFFVFATSAYRENEGAKDNLDKDTYWITPSIETPWIKLGGLAGYQRVKEVAFTLRSGVKSKPMLLVYVNHEDDSEDTYLFDSTVFEGSYVDRLVARLGNQKCRSIKLKLSDTGPSGTYLSTWGVRSWLGLRLTVGVRSGAPKIQSGNRV